MTTYRYKANDTESYTMLATFIAPCMDAQVTLYPLYKTIVIAYQGEDTDVYRQVAKHIDSNALNFHIEPVEIDGVETDELLKTQLNPASLRDLIIRKIYEAEESRITKDSLEAQLRLEKEDKDRYQQYWSNSLTEISALKEQMKAIITIMTPLTK